MGMLIRRGGTVCHLCTWFFYTDSTTYADGANSERVIFLIDLFVDLFFFCDIIVNFRTTYIDKNDVLVTDTKKIATRYLRTYFIVDFVAAIPWDVVAEYLEKVLKY